MFFEFKPWQLEVDVEGTKLFYEETDYSKDKAVNREFMESLTEEQKYFFDSLGVDISKIEIDKALYDIPEEGELPSLKMKSTTVNFLLKGKFLALPQYQKELYSDEEVFGKEFPDNIKILSSDEKDYIETGFQLWNE